MTRILSGQAFWLNKIKNPHDVGFKIDLRIALHCIAISALCEHKTVKNGCGVSK
jgi:hypothetical protein